MLAQATLRLWYTLLAAGQLGETVKIAASGRLEYPGEDEKSTFWFQVEFSEFRLAFIEALYHAVRHRVEQPEAGTEIFDTREPEGTGTTGEVAQLSVKGGCTSVPYIERLRDVEVSSPTPTTHAQGTRILATPLRPTGCRRRQAFALDPRVATPQPRGVAGRLATRASRRL